MDVSPKQLVSVAAALIPFLENDDANRALMGSNMQRQAVPLLRAEAPLRRHRHGGRRWRATRGAAIVARRTRHRRPGRRDAVSSCARPSELDPATPGVDIYSLRKFQRSNQNTCINQRPLVKVGDMVEAGEIIADGPSTERGELALGRTCSSRSCRGTATTSRTRSSISERIVQDDVFTSIHIEEFEVDGPRHQARAGGDHPRHPERRRRGAAATSTRPASSASAPRCSRATSWSARSRRRARAR